jgi:hypothetical protein
MHKINSKILNNLSTLSAGLIMRWVINHGFDYILYPVVLVWLGNTIGGTVLTILATIINIYLIKAYDWSKTDWFLIEKLKLTIENNTYTGWKHKLLNLFKQNRITVFFILCLDDPITVTLYFRKGSYKYNGMSLHDWKVFILANIVSNFYWIVGWAFIIELIATLLD